MYSERVRNKVEYRKRYFICINNYVNYILLYKYIDYDIFDNFLKILDFFLKIIEDCLNIV